MQIVADTTMRDLGDFIKHIVDQAERNANDLRTIVVAVVVMAFGFKPLPPHCTAVHFAFVVASQQFDRGFVTIDLNYTGDNSHRSFVGHCELSPERIFEACQLEVVGVEIQPPDTNNCFTLFQILYDPCADFGRQSLIGTL